MSGACPPEFGPRSIANRDQIWNLANTVCMYEDKDIEKLFGDETLQYLKNKNRGGASNAKGNTYENFFTVYQLARLSKEVIEGQESIICSSQILAFVDDLIINRETKSPLQHYQLKNKSSVSWDVGEKSISDDFKKQYELNQSKERESEVSLVVSSPNLKDKLTDEMPEDIKLYSQVIHFCHDSSLMKVLDQEPEFKKAVEYLCCSDNPERDKIECAATVLLGAWCSSDRSNASVLEVLTKAHDCNPSFIRPPLNVAFDLGAETKEILDSIQDFTYNFSKGFLHWEFKNGLGRGTLPYSCDTAKFANFQKLVRRDRPKSFEELESFLI